MAYLFGDGFDHYTTIGQKWDASSGSITLASGNARFADTNAQGASISGGGFIRKNFGANPGPTIFVFFSMSPVALSSGAGAAVLTLEDTGTTQVSLAFDTLGRPQFYRGNPTTNAIGSLGPAVLAAGVYHRFEVKIKIDGSVGTVELRVDGGSAIIASASLNTKASANAYITSIRIGDGFVGTGNHNGIKIDDVVILDDSGSTLKDFLGDRKILTVMPNGAGGHTQFTPSAGSNYQCVDEIPPNDDTDYVSDGTTNDRDSYTFQDATFTGSADYVNALARVRKDDAGTHTVKLTTTSNSVDALGSDTAVASTYAYISALFEQDPSTTAAWQQTGFNAAEFGIKITS